MRLLLLCLLLPLLAFGEEAKLLSDCGNKDLRACEKLGTYYLGTSQWEKARMIGETLCEKELVSGCTVAGSAALAQGQGKEGVVFLTKACDGFEPFACRSLGRHLKKANEDSLGRLYFKRACHYGLREVCSEAKGSGGDLSLVAREWLSKLKEECADTKSGSCQERITTLKACALPLNKQDCTLLAGQLSIFFRAKYIQAEAQALLLSIHVSQRSLKDSKEGSFSYDLSKVQKNAKVLERYNYLFGFMKGCGKKYVKARRPRTQSQELYPSAYRHQSARAMANSLSYLSKGKAEDCYEPKSGYEAYAVAALDPEDPTRLDVWKIDQDGRLENVSDGLPLP